MYQLRLCCDCRNLRAPTLQNVFGFPKIAEFSSKLKHNTSFTFLDLATQRFEKEGLIISTPVLRVIYVSIRKNHQTRPRSGRDNTPDPMISLDERCQCFESFVISYIHCVVLHKATLLDQAHWSR